MTPIDPCFRCDLAGEVLVVVSGLNILTETGNQGIEI